jgi:hypothetical protein
VVIISVLSVSYLTLTVFATSNLAIGVADY